MNVFVTGGAGYIGSVCVEMLLDEGHNVTVYDNLSEGHEDAVDPRALFIHARISDRSNINETVRDAEPDAIIHFAANSLVGESMKNPGKYFRNNVSNSLKVLDAAVEAGVKKFIFSSTAATYGIPKEMPITEETPTAPINPYGESKLAMEKFMRWYHEIHGLEYVALRYFNAAGASEQFGEHHRVETHLIPNILQVALGQKENCQIFGDDYPTPDGTCVRDYIHVLDLASAHILALKEGLSGVFNLGNGGGYSVKEVVDACRRITGKEIEAIQQPRRPGDPPKLVAAADKARQVLGWTPKHSALDNIVETAWRWHSAHPNGYAK